MSYKFKSQDNRAIFVAGFNQGTAFVTTVATLQGFKLAWTAKGKAASDRIKSICHDYVLSRVAADMGCNGTPEENAAKAQSEFSKKAWKKGAPSNDKYRTEKIDRYFRNASASLSRVCAAAGKPASKAGKNTGKGANKRDTEQTARPATTAGNGHNAPNNPAVMLASNAPKDYPAAYAIAALIADQAVKLESLATQNHVKLDALGTLLRDFAANFKALPAAAAIVEGPAKRNDKPRTVSGK